MGLLLLDMRKQSVVCTLSYSWGNQIRYELDRILLQGNCFFGKWLVKRNSCRVKSASIIFSFSYHHLCIFSSTSFVSASHAIIPCLFPEQISNPPLKHLILSRNKLVINFITLYAPPKNAQKDLHFPKE